MAKIVFPLSVRRKALRLFSDGHQTPKIARMLGCSKDTVKTWCKEAKVLSKSNLTEEELDQKIVEWGLDPKFDDSRAVQEAEEASRARTNARKSHRAKFGPSPMDGKNALKSFKEFGDPEEYQRAVDAWLVQTMEQLSHEETIEGQIKAMMAGVLLRQTSQAIQCPPPITNMTDWMNCIKMLRLTFGMDVQKNKDNVRIDLTILNGKVLKPRKPRVIDVPA